MPMRGGQANGNQSNEAVNGAASEESQSQVDLLTEELAKQRLADMFSDGSGVPAVKPKQ